MNQEDAKIQSVINRTSASILDIPEITGVALGGGHVIVYVEKVTIPILEKIPTEINGMPIEIKSSGQIRLLSLMQSPLLTTPLSNTAKVRPVIGGYSCGCPQITAGTFTTTVRDVSTGKKVGLSNNHVLLGAKWGTLAGYPNNPVYQPGVADGGTPSDTVGYTVRGVPVELSPVENLVDAAIFEPGAADPTGTILSDSVEGLGVVGHAVDPQVGKRGRKSGRTTGLTEANIESIGATIDVAGNGTARFVDQIIFRPALAQGGDSGSVVVDDNGNVLGIVFAGSDEITAVNPSRHLESLLGISFGDGLPIVQAGIPVLAGAALLVAGLMWWGTKK